MAIVGYRTDDWRGEPVWEVSYNATRDGVPESDIMPRQPAEFDSLATLLAGVKGSNVPPLPPGPRNATVLSEWLSALAAQPVLSNSSALVDFLSLDNTWWQKLPWFTKGTADYVWMVEFAPCPVFIPKLIRIAERDTLSAPGTSLEAYVFLASFQKGKTNLDWVVGLMRNYTAQCATWEAVPPAPADGSDLWAPGASEAPQPSEDYVKQPVHMLPGSYLNGQTVRIDWLTNDKFTYMNITKVHLKLGEMYAGEHPQRVLDMGTGTGATALAFAALFPSAEVVGIDLAPPQVRFSRFRAAETAVHNVDFYWADARNTSFAAGSFDAVHFTYVLHEMNTTDAVAILREARRLLRPGGKLTAFECPYFENKIEREQFIKLFTFAGNADADRLGFHGPEPFFGEFEAFEIDAALPAAGFANVTKSECSMYECVFQAVSP